MVARAFLLSVLLAFTAALPASARAQAQEQARDLPAPLIRAIKDGNWAIALAEAGAAHVTSYILWRALQDHSREADFATLAGFIRTHHDWPRLNRLQLRLEKQLFQGHHPEAAIRGWFAQYPPISGYGMLALSRLAPDTARVRHGWIQGDFERHDEPRILSEFATALNRDTHRARGERLLREGKTEAAERMLSYVGEDYAALFRARIALQRRQRGLEAKIARIPAALKDDHGLLADRLRWRHDKGLRSGVRELLLAMDAASPYAGELWRIRALHARDAIEEGAYAQAARLLRNAGSTLDGAAQADALWLKGWLALTFRNDAKKAYEHFYRLFHHVSYPISRARGAYWAARAAQANGNTAIAQDWLKLAAQYPTAFYGQLAQAERAPGEPLRFPAAPAVDEAAYRAYRGHALVKLALAFYHAGQDELALPLLTHLAAEAETPGHLAALMRICTQHRLLHAQVKVAKYAQRDNLFLPQGWPRLPLPDSTPLEPSLALAIARQESEFNPRAVSSANARGLMQLLPSTGRKVADKLELNYTLEKLFDPVFNLRLGSHYLHDLIEGFNGKLILAVAGYNAGPGRSREWVQRFGQPGGDLAQTLTFMELIPFAETRNYVQRVLEHRQTYRALENPSAPLKLTDDLLR